MTTPGKRWRVAIKNGSERIEYKNQGIFDELVIDDWLHLEKMDARHWWMQVGDLTIDVHVSKRGHANVSTRLESEESKEPSHARPPTSSPATALPDEPRPPHERRKFGSAEGEVIIHPSFFDPTALVTVPSREDLDCVIAALEEARDQEPTTDKALRLARMIAWIQEELSDARPERT